MVIPICGHSSLVTVIIACICLILFKETGVATDKLASMMSSVGVTLEFSNLWSEYSIYEDLA